jgi:urea transport system ATP-binding protein
MLKIEQLNQFYGQSHTLWDIDLEVPKGQCTVLMGRNGVASGTMVYAGQDVLSVSAEQRARLGIGYVPQGRQIFPLLSVEENLLIGLPARSDRVRRIPDFIFELFPVLREMLSRRGGDLSGGQQQQLAIGRALVIDPKLLILDEPTEGIQPNIVAEIGDIVCRLNRDIGLTVLLVEQKLPFARKVADRYCLIDRGRAVAGGAMSELTEQLIQKHLVV